MTSIPLAATFYRGGTSKAVCFVASALPSDRTTWPNLFMSLMGTPDPNGRQLNGMGGGISSVSKVIVVEPSTRRDADVDYTFYQLGTKLPGEFLLEPYDRVMLTAGSRRYRWELR